MPSIAIAKQSSGKKTAARALLSAAVIASLFFIWTLLVNWAHGVEQALRAGAGQATVSFIASMSMAFMVEFFFAMPRTMKSLRIPFAVAATMSIVITTTAGVHMLIGTPEIIKTMALPFTMGVVYTSLYSFRLSRMESITI